MFNQTCHYIEGNVQRTHNRYIENCSKALASDLAEHGWRRFGHSFFRPVCEGCFACESLKIDANHFTLSKSLRRVVRKNTQTKIYIQTPSYSYAHIALYHKYHEYKTDTVGWEERRTNFEEYYRGFVEGHGEFGKEVLYFIDEKLVGVDLIDILDSGISSVYFYYDPEVLKYELGKFSLIVQIDLAHKLGLPWIYLGYNVKSCPSLNYKERYKPYHTLVGRPEMDEVAIWIDTDKEK